jgi:T-complex protein 1 subunit eta
MLLKCAGTALNSKLLANYRDHFSELVVKAVERLDSNLLDKDLIGIKMVTGGSIMVSNHYNFYLKKNCIFNVF